ncbi:MAG: bifunctional demethylmenaquinone methyltransferase/2-methoxy-6-polyprenyl-1,4-benzoquinol methylase UbiE [Limisphaerales bacterium]
MSSTYYEPGEQRALKVKELFARIAPRYDLINDLQSFGLHRFWKRRVVSLAHATQGDSALDICCGTGDLTFAFAAKGIRAMGLDFTSEMLEVAQKRARRQIEECRDIPNAAVVAPAGRNPRFIRGDAQRIPFRDSSFDVVTVGYGLRNLSDWHAGLAEMFRVLAGRGRLLVLDFGKPDNALWRRLYFTYLRLFVPILGKVFCGSGEAYAYILESLKQYPAQHGVAAAMRELGFAHVQIVGFIGGVMTINYGEKPPS